MRRLLGVFAAETGLIWLLHRAGPMFPVDLATPLTWLRFTPPDQIVMAAIRYAALGFGYWLLLSTVVYSTGVIASLPGLVRSVEWATVPMVRNAARRAVALSLASTTMAPTAAFVVPAFLVPAATVGLHTAAEDLGQEERNTEVVVGVPDRDTFIPPGATLPRESPLAPPSVATPRLSTSTTPAEPPDQLTAQTTSNYQESGVDVRAAALHTVAPGDNLWTIAARHLQSDDSASPLTESQIAPYWAQVVELNRQSLRSQNPDWIYPGEEIQLPPING